MSSPARLVVRDRDQSEVTYLTLAVINWSSFPIKVVAWTFIGPTEVFPTAYMPLDRPLIVDSRDGADLKVEAMHLKGDPEGMLVAWIRLATGEEFRPDPFDPRISGLGEPLQVPRDSTP